MTAFERIKHERDHGSLTARAVDLAPDKDSRTVLLPPAEWEQAEDAWSPRAESERLYWGDAAFVIAVLAGAMPLGVWALVELLT